MKRSLPNKHLLLSLLVLLFIYSSKVSASHTMGADLTYQCLGGNTYKVTVSFYRDCIGIAAPTSPYVTISSTTCSKSIGVTCYPRPGTGQEVTPACSTSVTTCNGGSFTGIQEWVYDGIITLPAQCSDWKFGYSLCCRNAAITTINSPSGNTFYIYATLNNLISTCNSSPTFSNKPVPFLCKGQQYCFNHGAYDVDGDSLVYSLITPYQTATTTVTYHAPYNASNPLNSAPATSFNTATGDICLNPQALEVTVMAVLVSEYRNGQLIGSVERDLQLTVMNCANNLPSLTGINGTNNFSMTICANQQTCFNIFSNDPDAGQQLSVDWNSAIPGGTFTSGSGLHPTATFCWTPTSADIGNSYTFTVRVQDNACPYFGSQIYSYTIHVIGITVNAGADQAIACSDLATLSAVASGGSGTYTYLWSNGSTMQAITVGEGTYTVTANDGSCSATDTVKVTLPYIPTAEFNHSPVLCLNNPIQFNDQSTTPGGYISNYDWNFGDGSTSNLQNPSHQFSTAGTYQVSLIIQNNLGCIDTVVHSITIVPPPLSAFTGTNSCINTSVSFTDQSTGTVNYWHWYFGDGSTSFLQNPSHNYTSAGTFNAILISGDTLGCIDSTSHTITIYPQPIINAGTDQSVCDGSPLTLTATGGVSYVWTPSNTTGQSFTFTPTGSLNIIVIGTDVNGCSSADTVSVSINPLPAISAGSNQFICQSSSVTLNATGGISYIWMPGNYTSPNYTVDPTSTTSYTVVGTGANGCTASSTVTVNVGNLPIANAGPDVSVCSGQSTTLTASGGLNYSWNPIGSTSSTVNVSPTNTTQYQVIVSDASGCSSTAYVTVNVNSNPVVNLQSFFLCAGSTTTLNASNPGSTYLWNTNETTQTIQISSGGNYNVTVTTPNGCQASSACTISYGNALTINLANVSFCTGASTVLDAGYPGMTYLWTPNGQTSQSITVTSPGNYGVTVTDSLGCSGSINISAIQNPLPIADFSSTSVCLGNATTFTDGSSASSGSLVNWVWNFSDGSTSTSQNPIHTFSTSGNFSVLLTVTNSNGCTNTVSRNVIVNPLPVADFSMPNACAGTTINFTNTSSVSVGFISTQNWNFGDGTISTAQNPNHQYTTPGNYTVTLQVTTAGGCSNSTSQTIIIHPNPVAQFATTSVCLGTNSTFTNSSSISTGTIANYLWDFNDTYSSTQQNPSHNYTVAGTYSVGLLVISDMGCRDSIRTNEQVNALPVANAGADQTICFGNKINLTATGGISYSWMPGALSGNIISVTPNSNSAYTVTVTNANGCTATDIVNVNVNPLPTANAGGNKSICIGNNITLNGSGGYSYLWSPGNQTTQSITVNPNTTTNYTLTVTDLNGCQANDLLTLTVNSLPSILVGPDKIICNGSTIQLSASGAISYNWNPLNITGQNILVSPTSNTIYSVVGTDNNGCTSSDTIEVFVNAVPTVTLTPTLVCVGHTSTLDAGNAGSTFYWSTGETNQSINVSDSGNVSVVVTSPNGCSGFGQTTVTLGGDISANPTTVEICSGATTTLSAGNPGATYSWSTGATTQTINTSSAGNYFVTITDVNGCAATMLNVVKVNPLPIVNFSAFAVCSGNMIQFNNSSTISSGSISNYNWTFGDNTSAANIQPNHFYTSAGTYTVTLSATSVSGCSMSITKSVIVYPKPIASFTTADVCLGQSVAFTNNSSVSSGTINSLNWNFGDGNVSSGSNQNHTYTNQGLYVVTLIVNSDDNCSDTIIKKVNVKGLPIASFTVPNNCSQTTFNFQNTSHSAFGNISSYQWNLGNGTTSTMNNPSLVYSSSGNYSVTLTATSNLGCTATTQQTVIVYPIPSASFTTTGACMNSNVVLNNTSTISSGSIHNFNWNFGDNTSSVTTQPNHSYTSAGNFQVSLIAISDMGCRDTAVGTTTSFELPVISFVTQHVCLGADVDFLNTSPLNNAMSWTWNLGDGTNSTVFQPTHTYSKPGNFQTQLTGTNSNGCSVTANGVVNIYPNPAPAFSVANVCLGTNNQFINQTTVEGGIPFTSQWSMADGTTSGSLNPIHNFIAAGNYNINLMATTANGCIGQISHNLKVYNPPVARFIGDDVCKGISTQFIDQSYSQDGNIVGWIWDFGDNSSSDEGSPAHNYINAANYQVTLTTTSIYGCFDRFIDSVSIYEKPSAAIHVTSACEGSPVQFANASSGGSQVNYTWDLGNGFNTSDSSFNYTFPTSGTYNVTLVAVDQYNCSATELARVDVYPNPQPNFAVTEVCQNAASQFINQSFVGMGNQIVSYNWNFGDQNTSSQTNPNHTFSQYGNYNVNLVATTNHGCVQAKSIVAKVNPNPVAIFAAGAQGCGPITSSFTASSSVSEGAVVGWLWSFGDGEISTQQNPAHTFSTKGNYDVNLTVVSDKGCYASYTGQNVIKVYPSPTANFSTDVTVTDILYPTIHFQNESSNYTAYQWTFGDGTASSTELNPTHTFSDTGFYTAQLITTNAFGCKDTILKSIEVRPTSTLFVPNCFTPNGDGKNDVFKPYHTNMNNLQVWVFDRWGLLLKTWSALEGSWDGYYEGKKCQEDTYVYKIVGDGIDGKHSEWVGHVSIVY